MKEIIINTESMHKYFAMFDATKHKLFYDIPDADDTLVQKAFDIYREERMNQYWDVTKATEVYCTLEKVYNFSTEKSVDYCNLLQKVIEDFMGDYLRIDGIQELFRSSYFYFEWMMHLEYKEKQHNYSFYRDHYIHQIRNLYEMFRLLDDFDMWRKCMEVYKHQCDSVGCHIRESIRQQIKSMPKEEKDLQLEISQIAVESGTEHQEKKKRKEQGDALKKQKERLLQEHLEEMQFRFLLFSVAIVSSLIHDIGYPIVYMKRTMEKTRQFLPLSNLFMNLEDEMPRIRSVLSESLLFEMVDGNEIEKRLKGNDHGAYSAIILLFQYYDNGHIFQLEPIKRMVIELSALVIYNHTLHYVFQDKKHPDRYYNMYHENPMSYLFRLCDDLQEWERVYFDISKESNFFICGRCKMPLIKNLEQSKLKSGIVPQIYHCCCGNAGLNTNLFDYRRLINVAPFREMYMRKTPEGDFGVIELKCDLKALLQLVKYNPRFAMQRTLGIHEVKEMLKEQKGLPDFFLDTFVSNNPIAIKCRILFRFLQRCGIEGNVQSFRKEPYIAEAKYVWWPKETDEKKKKETNKEIIRKNREYLDKLKEIIRRSGLVEEIWKRYVEKYKEDVRRQKKLKLSIRGSSFRKDTESIWKSSIEFHLFLLIMGHMLQEGRPHLKLEGKEEEVIAQALMELMRNVTEDVADVWNISDAVYKELLTDYFEQAFCEIDADTFKQKKYLELYHHYLNCREDMEDIVKTYTRNTMYREICKSKSRHGHDSGMLMDYYSDYYLYFTMDMEVEL